MALDINVNKKFEPALHSKKRHIVLLGGAGSGKSYFCAQKLLLKIINKPKRRELVLRKVFKTIRESCFALLLIIIHEWGIQEDFKVNETSMKITYKNGSHIVFSGLDDSEKLKSIHGITGIWVEEATDLTQKDTQEIDRRAREKSDEPVQITWSFNPISRKHHLLKRFFCDAHGKIPRDNVCYIHSTYIDNRSNLDETFIDELVTLKQRDPEDYRVYALGEWGSGEPGLIFQRRFLKYWHTLPEDLVGVLFVDPNLAKKSKGDTTGMSAIMYSAQTGYYYLVDYRCLSFSKPSDLLESVINIKANNKGITTIGFDGNVNQESNWTSHVRNYCLTNAKPFPVIRYKRYNVDELAKNAQWLWSDGRILLPHNIESTLEGEEYLLQLVTFSGKKNSPNRDDAPDSFVSAIELFHETYAVPIQRRPQELTKNFKERAEELSIF